MVCVCVLDAEGNRVFASTSRALVVVSDQFPWNTFATWQMSHQFQKQRNHCELEGLDE